MKTQFLSVLTSLFALSAVLSAQDMLAPTISQRSVAQIDTRTRLPSVNPAVYCVGPGDIFEIRCSKMPWATFTATINEIGLLTIPEFGSFNLSGKKLNQAIAYITSTISKNPIAGEVTATLNSCKMADVLVTGSAIKSNTYRLSGSLSVLDALNAASHDSLISPEIDLRNITVSYCDSTLSVDIARYLAKGDQNSNPYLFPGSVISVYPIEHRVTISGAVSGAIAQTVPLREGETFENIFSLFHIKKDADTTHITLVRSGKGRTEMSLSKLLCLTPQNNDHVIVGMRPEHARIQQVTVSGELLNPGTYPIIEGQTTASDIIPMAGGITSLGDSMHAFIRRADVFDTTADRKITNGLISVRPERSFAAKQMIASKDYRIIPLDPQKKTSLESGDEIIIPRLSRSVYVSGYVKQPGAYPFVSNKPATYYIDRAGGYAANADGLNTKIIASYGDSWMIRQGPLAPGDIVMVPEQVEGKILTRISTIIGIISGMATVLLTTFAIQDRLNK